MNYLTKKEIKFPKRKRESKKGDNGRVLIIGGSKDYVGAVALAGMAALRSGCDWVTIAALEKVAWSINTMSPDLVTVKLKGDYFSLKHSNEILKLINKHDTILIGNGIGLNNETKSFVKKVIKIKKLIVIDADGIKSLSINNLENSIITPHNKELEIFLKNSKINDSIIKKIIKEKSIIKKSLLIKKTLKKFFVKDNVILLKWSNDKAC